MFLQFLEITPIIAHELISGLGRSNGCEVNELVDLYKMRVTRPYIAYFLGVELLVATTGVDTFAKSEEELVLYLEFLKENTYFLPFEVLFHFGIMERIEDIFLRREE